MFLLPGCYNAGMGAKLCYVGMAVWTILVVLLLCPVIADDRGITGAEALSSDGAVRLLVYVVLYLTPMLGLGLIAAVLSRKPPRS